MLINVWQKINLIMLIFVLIKSKYNPDISSVKTGGPMVSQNLQAGTCTYSGGIANSATAIQLGNCGQNLYFIRLQLGSNNQVFDFQVDTGSNILWIPLATNNQTGFNSSQSASYNPTTQNMTLSYADGSSVSGDLGSDLITITNTNISVVGLILFGTTVIGMNYPGSVTGLVGMGYSYVSNFIDTAYQKQQISTSVFSLDLNPNSQTSYLYYNNGLPTQMKQNMYWIDQYAGDHWQVQVIGMFAGSIQFTNVASDAAIIDSGTSLFLLNQNLYDSVIQQYFSGSGCYQDNQGNVYCPCGSSSSWPTFGFMFIGVQVFIQGNSYQYPIGNGSCLANFQTLQTVDSILLGDIFFRGYTVSFDKLNSRIGFYGNTKQIFIFQPQYFLLTQYVMSSLMTAWAFVGIGICICNRVSLRDKRIQRNLGIQLM